MIRSELTGRIRAIDDLEAYLDSFNSIAAEEFQTVFPPIQKAALSELETEPGPVRKPIVWTSDKQRKAFFATDGFGSGIPYRRSGALSRSWQFDGSAQAGEINARIQNTNPASQFVYGSLAQSNPGRFQQQMHINTGWQRAYDTVHYWLNALKEDYTAAMRERWGDVLAGIDTRTRAYTRRQR